MAVLWVVLMGILAFDAAFFSLDSHDLSTTGLRKDNRDKAIIVLSNFPGQLQITNLILAYVMRIGVLTLMVVQLLVTEGSVTAWFAASFGTLFFLLAGEFAVKAFAVRRKVSVSRSAAPLFKIFLGLLRPITGTVLRLVRFLALKYGGGQEFTTEMNQVLDRALHNSRHSAPADEVAQGIVNFNSFLVKDLMQHRKDIFAVPVTASFKELTDHINTSGLSRIPVYRDTLDKIEGVVYTKDFLPFIDQQEDFAWQKLLRPALFIDEDVKIIALLKDFQQKHVHIALVVDKSGRIAGLITLQDLIEEVMGNINKDYDPVPPKP